MPTWFLTSGPRLVRQHVFDGLAAQDACVAEVRIRGYSETPPEDWNGAYALLTK